jgi:hypothetical protein
MLVLLMFGVIFNPFLSPGETAGNFRLNPGTLYFHGSIAIARLLLMKPP